jgi:hypothetical protein
VGSEVKRIGADSCLYLVGHCQFRKQPGGHFVCIIRTLGEFGCDNGNLGIERPRARAEQRLLVYGRLRYRDLRRFQNCLCRHPLRSSNKGHLSTPFLHSRHHSCDSFVPDAGAT